MIRRDVIRRNALKKGMIRMAAAREPWPAGGARTSQDMIVRDQTGRDQTGRDQTGRDQSRRDQTPGWSGGRDGGRERPDWRERRRELARR